MIESPFFLGRVEYIKPESNVVEFSVPHVIENMTKYPEAYPIGNHTHKMNVGDSVFIIKVSDLNRFVYQPIDFNPFVGVRYSDKNYIELKGDDELTIRVKGKDILKVSATKIEFIDTGLPPFNKIFTCGQCLLTQAPISSNTMILP